VAPGSDGNVNVTYGANLSIKALQRLIYGRLSIAIPDRGGNANSQIWNMDLAVVGWNARSPDCQTGGGCIRMPLRECDDQAHSGCRTLSQEHSRVSLVAASFRIDRRRPLGQLHSSRWVSYHCDETTTVYSLRETQEGKGPEEAVLTTGTTKALHQTSPSLYVKPLT